jgi:2-polyprenyl-3-methyl-5-hydroxy-6-metoxy-1,4-benzoquinol methylase
VGNPTEVAAQKDASNGYEALASEFIKRRGESNLGVATVRKWAHTLPPGAVILDLGCGHGDPLAVSLIDDGYEIYGIDASPTLVAAFQRRLPQAHVTCEAVEDSSLFARSFDAVLAVGLIFLLDPNTQRELIRKAAQTLTPGGGFLFTAPRQVRTWTDIMTGLPSRSLGAEAYEAILMGAGLTLVDEYVDQGENHYFAARK